MKPRRFVAEIQALRAIAVLLVLTYHAGIGLFPGGFIGVDVFFVISGFLITSLLLRELQAADKIDFLAFYARRIRRLLPAATVVLLATTVAAWYNYSPLDFKQYSSSAIATAVYLSNFWFAHLATDYLAADTHQNPLLHTWSLSVEEQFYLVWPVLLFLLYRVARGQRWKHGIVCGMTLLCVISFLASLYLTSANQPLAFFGSPTRAWEFGVGGLIALHRQSGAYRDIHGRPILFAVGLGLIFLSATLYSNTMKFPGFAAALPVAGTALVLLSCLGGTEQGYSRWMRLAPIQYLGDISYSLYLWHWPLQIFLFNDPERTAAYTPVLYLGLSIALASLTYHFVENPIRFSPRVSRRTSSSFATGALLTAMAALSIGTARWESARELSSERQRVFSEAAANSPVTYADGCHLAYFDLQSGDCKYGVSDAKRTIVLFGDSHAAQWFPALERISRDSGFALVNMTKSGCPSLAYEPFSKVFKRPYTECTQWRLGAFERIKSMMPDIVIVANSSHYLLNAPERQASDGFADWAAAAKQTFSTLEAMGSRVVLIRDTPRLPFSAPSCLSRAVWKDINPDTACRFSTSSARHDRVFEIENVELDRAKAGTPLDMTHHICENGANCPTLRDTMVLFLDDNHITANFSRHLADALLRELRLAGEVEM